MSETDERDYRATLNLPQTEFPMRADLPKREPDRVAWWKEHGTFARRLAKNKADGNPHWILHDGPPYANGELHMGHFLNMVLKDVFVKIALLDGKQTPFVPGWDMHGLPIELETLKHLGIKDFHSIDPIELREKCKERALYWLARQRDVRVRMGNFGDWDHPYMTIAPEFEATIVETLATLAEKEQLYRGLRSTLWCIHDETALAEAEIEYENKTSPSVYVRFKANDEQRAELLAKFGVEQPGALSVLIWTTTPWTLPANVAIALRADAEYGLYRVGEELLVLASALAPKALGDAFETATRLGTATGAQLDGLSVRHPFLDRDSLLVLADYVELETGTGAVHTAPGHGADDFETGVKYNLPILNPVDARGIFTQEAGPYAGMHIWKANKQIVEDLQASGALWRMHEYEHSYPHCWRCHNPVIFRATAQWFIALDMNHLRQNALDAIGDVAYTPEWGQNRQSQMIETHPEWCVSRQRTWGTPIPALICQGCNDSFLDPAVARRAAARFREAGAGTWWSDPLETFVPAGSTVCPKCGSNEFEREKNIVDIWFESGVTHFAVLGTPDLPWPSDLVLEGGDQYRGWFRSSLLTAVAVKGTAPYKHVVKNGWVNDEQGRPMSKSKGTGIDARDAMEKWGADVLRLWAASVEFVDDVRFGPTVVTQVGNVYRNLRNRIRFILSNLYDFGTADIVPREKLEPLDALACDVTDDFADKVVADYGAFGVHDAYLRIVEFDRSMSSLYLDALKDPLYSRAANDPRRRSAQSALLYILRRLLAVSAPVLSFTTEEAWQALSEDLRGAEQSVFDLPLAVTHHRDTAESVRRWDRLRALRGRVAASTEPRDFEARVSLSAVPAVVKELAALGDGLREALVVSEVTLSEGDTTDADGIAGLEIANAHGAKCKRCWKFRDLGTNKAHPEICSECAEVVTAV